MADDAPRILAGRYEVGELIGRGGMAEVHIGHDTRLGRTVAIKILRSDLARDPSFQARFRREAQSAAALNHPAIVAVYDTGEEVYTEPGGAVAHVPFIVMEYVEGHTVRDILRDGHAVPIDEAVEIVSGVLSALEYSHQAGIVHRDIKPANVMITPTGAVKVMDFGIARAVADSAATMTQTQAVIGTAQYLSPEQARGESVDARSDLYSTGCLLFELLTGRPPFVGDSPVAVAYQHVREMPPRPSSLAGDVPEVLDRITLKALAKDREDRYSSAAEFRSDLEAALHGGQIAAPPFAVVAAAATGAPQAELDPNATQVLGAPATQALPATWSPTGVSSSADGPDPEDEGEEKKSRKGLMWTLIAVGVLAIAAIITLLIINSNREPEVEMVVVPPLEGMTVEEVQAALEEVDLVLSSRSEASEEVEEDLFVRSEPAPGEEASAGSTVVVYFSVGPDTVLVPDVEGLTQAQARQELEDANLRVGDVETRTGGSVPRDQVMATDPEANEPVQAGTVVNLIVSDGQVDVPNVVGETREDALRIIDELDANISVNVIQQESEEDEDQVIDQSPSAGPVTQGSRIQLTVAIPMPAELVAVPMNLVGMTQADAEAALRQVGLVPRIETDESTDEVAGHVFGVTPQGGLQVDVGSEVTLYVSTGPGPEPDPTDEPTDDDNGDGNEG